MLRNILINNKIIFGRLNVNRIHQTYYFSKIEIKQEQQQKPQKIDIDQKLSQLIKIGEQLKGKIKKNSPQDRLKYQEEKSKQINSKVMKRELMADLIQLPIKTTAYLLSGLNSGTFKAELIRSGIDAINHLILFSTSFINLNPSTRYPYGLEKIKNLVVMIPAVLFFIFGLETIISSFHEILYENSNHAEENSREIFSLMLITASLGIEMTVIGYNLVDAYKVQQKMGDQVQKISFFNILKAILKKKDPLLQAILYENAISICSMSVPFACGLISQFYTSPYIGFMGSTMIGLIQLSCAYHLGKENIISLLGQGVDEEILKDIVGIIKSNEFIIDLQEVKAVMIGSLKFRFFAELTYDIEKINKRILKDYSSILESIIYNEDYEDREDDLNDLLVSVPLRLFKEIQIQKESIENNIKEIYPECLHVDLEMQQLQLLKIFDDEEKIKNYFLNMKEDNSTQTNTNEFNQKWLENQIDYYLGIDWSRFKLQNIKIEQKENQFSFLRKNVKFYDLNYDQIDLEEYMVILEKKRIQVIKDEIENLPENNWQNSEYPFKQYEKK